jgi:2-succinyl-6-hydroxy-2,4-cyclohexadiene-1-carboxylate synthase
MIHVARGGNLDGQAVLLLHGFMGSSRDWGAVAQALGDEYLCVMPDLPGHGKSVRVDENQYEMSAIASQLLQNISPASFHVLGYSMGARLALYLALRHPERIKSATIISGSAGPSDDSERVARQKSDALLASQLQTQPLPGFMQDWYNQPLWASLKESPEFAALFVDRLDNDPEGLAKSLRLMGLGAQPSLWPVLEGCQVPTHFICGERDEKFTDLAKRMAKLCPGSVLTVVKGCGHNVVHEAPGVLVECVRKWLSKE